MLKSPTIRDIIMYAYDSYESSEPIVQPQNCFQQAVILAVEHNVSEVYWIQSEGHFYVVVPKQEYAIGEVEFYTRLKAKDVEKWGVKYEITASDKARFLP